MELDGGRSGLSAFPDSIGDPSSARLPFAFSAVFMWTAGSSSYDKMSAPPAEFKTFQSPTAPKDVAASELELQRTTNASSRHVDTPDARFIAGQQFYNHEMYGSLRKGGAVNFWSKHCLGLVAATFASVFSLSSLGAVLQPLLHIQFGLTSAQSVAAQRLTNIPMALSFIVGMLSDCYPIMGLRRKGYMVLGLLITTVSFLVMAGLSAVADKNNPSLGLTVVAVNVAAIATLGNLMSYLSVHTRVIELSQREPLGSRGAIQASYLMFRFFVTLIADGCTYGVWGDGSSGSTNVPLAVALVIFAVLMIAPLPIIWLHWEEKHYSLSTSMKVRSRIFWKIIQQKAVWRVLVFMCFFTLFISVTFSNSVTVVSTWAGANKDDYFGTQAIGSAVSLLTVIVWRRSFMNRPWRQFFGAAPVFVIVPHLIAAILVCLDIERNRYLYRLLYSLTGVGSTIQLLTAIVPLTEIIIEGSEGAMVGLTLSLYFLVQIFVGTNSQGLFQGSNFYDVTAAAADASDARVDVLLSLVLNFGLNALAFIGLIFLPSQKLDVQQLRIYGGYTKSASGAIVAFAVVLLAYSLIVTVMSLIPSVSCLRLAGGSGC
jgi:hypothetical protein